MKHGRHTSLKRCFKTLFYEKEADQHFVPRAGRFSERAQLNLGEADWHRLNSTPLLPCTFPSGENIYTYLSDI